MSTVDSFLKRFHESKDVDSVFTNGCCYWFATILFSRFLRYGAEIVFDETECHFGTKINDKVFDITGDVTDKYTWIPWSSVTDQSRRARIIRDCIMF